MRFNKLTIVIALLSLLAALTFEVGYASPRTSRSNGTIVGRVLDCNGARVTNAAISIENGELERRLKSNEDGEFEISLPAGVYRITVEADGFRRFVYSSVKIRATATKRMNIYLDVAEPPGLVPASGATK